MLKQLTLIVLALASSVAIGTSAQSSNKMAQLSERVAFLSEQFKLKTADLTESQNLLNKPTNKRERFDQTVA